MASKGPRSRRSRLAAITVPIRGGDLRGYRAWSKRDASVGGPLSALAGFGEWFPRARDAWISEAVEAGLWTPSNHGSHDAKTYCRAAEPDRVLGHVADADGTVFHLVVDDAPRSVSLRAAYCRTTVADEVLDHTWTDDQRLTYEDVVAGEPCRGCGRPLHGGPELDVAVMHRTPEQQTAIETEESAFRSLHPDCKAMRWSIHGGGVLHCGRCCPPPPLDPATIERVAPLLARMLVDHRNRQDQLARKWGSASKPT
jgi:hypothetical protein